jgi:hypothetical protein
MDKILHEFIDISMKDSKAEFECSVLPGLIQTKDVADRIQKCIQTISLGSFTEISMLRTSYPQNIRVEVQTPQLIQKVCMNASFKGIPLKVEKKNPYPISNNTLAIHCTFKASNKLTAVMEMPKQVLAN